MESKDQLFLIELPDASNPIYIPTINAYVGNAEELSAFADQIERATTAEEMRNIVDAIRRYPEDPNPTYTWEAEEIEVYSPLKEVGCKEFLLSDHTWIHTAPRSGNQYLMRSKHVWLSYILGQLGDRYHQFCKMGFEGLEISTPGIGWVPLRGTAGGLPGMVVYEAGNDEKSGMMIMALHRWEKCLNFRSREPSVEDLPGPLSADLSTGVVEILGGY